MLHTRVLICQVQRGCAAGKTPGGRNRSGFRDSPQAATTPHDPQPFSADYLAERMDVKLSAWMSALRPSTVRVHATRIKPVTHLAASGFCWGSHPIVDRDLEPLVGPSSQSRGPGVPTTVLTVKVIQLRCAGHGVHSNCSVVGASPVRSGALVCGILQWLPHCYALPDPTRIDQSHV